MQFIYIIGAQCTGKTTLSTALIECVRSNGENVSYKLLSETARAVLRLHSYTREDVRAGGPRCFELQRLIMQGQHNAEKQAIESHADVVISDRSGLDPLVYTHLYCGEEDARQLSASDTWAELRVNMQRGIVVVCEPVADWLFDDGVRLVPSDWKEWSTVHERFCKLLEDNEIEYRALPASVKSLEARVEMVRSWRS